MPAKTASLICENGLHASLDRDDRQLVRLMTKPQLKVDNNNNKNKNNMQNFSTLT